MDQIKIGKFIAKCRKDNKITQSELAEKTGMKQSAIARIERMRVSPRVDTLMHLLNQIGYTLKIVPLQKNKNK